MNSELMKKLESLLNKFQERALSLREEYYSITSIDNDLTKEDISRIKEIKDTTKQMTEEGYPLEYLNIDYNLTESEKNIEKIKEKIYIN